MEQERTLSQEWDGLETASERSMSRKRSVAAWRETPARCRSRLTSLPPGALGAARSSTPGFADELLAGGEHADA